jgi:IS5 family transposase
MSHPLVKLAQAIDWGFLEANFGAVYSGGLGQPPLPMPVTKATTRRRNI